MITSVEISADSKNYCALRSVISSNVGTIQARRRQNTGSKGNTGEKGIYIIIKAIWNRGADTLPDFVMFAK